MCNATNTTLFISLCTYSCRVNLFTLIVALQYTLYAEILCNIFYNNFTNKLSLLPRVLHAHLLNYFSQSTGIQCGEKPRRQQNTLCPKRLLLPSQLATKLTTTHFYPFHFLSYLHSHFQFLTLNQSFSQLQNSLYIMVGLHSLSFTMGFQIFLNKRFQIRNFLAYNTFIA